MNKRIPVFLLSLVLLGGTVTGAALAADEQPTAVPSPTASLTPSPTAEATPAAVETTPEPTMPVAEETTPESATPLTGEVTAANFLYSLRLSAGLSEKEIEKVIPEEWDGEASCIRRCDAALILFNTMRLLKEDAGEDVSGAPYVLRDYGDIPAAAQTAVCQMVAKGIMDVGAEEDEKYFRPLENLTEPEAALAIDRLLNEDIRTPRSLVDDNPYRLANAPNGTTPIAIWLQEQGYLNGANTTPAFRKLFFGDENKYGFESYDEPGQNAVTITLNVWKLDENGEKYPDTMRLWVHKLVAADVYDIFQQIFEDEEQFPITLLGCAGFGDDMRHCWLTAIDINSEYNSHASNEVGHVVTISGRGWWPLGTEKTDWAAFLKEASPYSIPAGGSVVKAFADYGWGWGGSWRGYERDYMHFSIFPDGG